jgi:hypothetical protein
MDSGRSRPRRGECHVSCGCRRGDGLAAPVRRAAGGTPRSPPRLSSENGTVPVGDAPPAVVGLLAGEFGRCGFEATLVDLAARGWFRLSPAGVPAVPAGQSGTWGPPGPDMCTVCAEPPGERLTLYERRVVAHLGLRAGARGEVPAGARPDQVPAQPGPDRPIVRTAARPSGEPVVGDRPRAPKGRPGLPGILLLGRVRPHGQDRHQPTLHRGRAGGPAEVACGRRPDAGHQVAAPGGRLHAYAVTLGAAPNTAAVFAPVGKDALWSSYRGSWQQLSVEKTTWPWPRAVIVILAIIFGPIVYFGGVFWLFTHGLAGLAERVIGLTAAAAVTFAAWLASRSAFPRFAEFDGQVISQSFVKGGDDSPDEYHVVIDDGERATAWDFTVGSGPYRRLTPGTFVHVRVNLRRQEQVSVEPMEPPPVARSLAGGEAEQRRAARGGLPDPADLVTADDAAYVLGAPVTGEHIPNPAGQTMTWRPTGEVPAGADGYRPPREIAAGSPAAAARGTTGPVGSRRLPAGRARMAVSGLAHDDHQYPGHGAAGNEASLTWLMPRAEARLRHWLAETATAGDTEDRS